MELYKWGDCNFGWRKMKYNDHGAREMKRLHFVPGDWKNYYLGTSERNDEILQYVGKTEAGGPRDCK